MALITFLHLKTVLTLRDHPSLEWFPQCLVVLADNVCAGDLTVRGVCNRNGQWAHGKCAQQPHSPIDILLVASVIKYKVDTVLRQTDCSVLAID